MWTMDGTSGVRKEAEIGNALFVRCRCVLRRILLVLLHLDCNTPRFYRRSFLSYFRCCWPWVIFALPWSCRPELEQVSHLEVIVHQTEPGSVAPACAWNRRAGNEAYKTWTFPISPHSNSHLLLDRDDASRPTVSSVKATRSLSCGTSDVLSGSS